MATFILPRGLQASLLKFEDYPECLPARNTLMSLPARIRYRQRMQRVEKLFVTSEKDVEVMYRDFDQHSGECWLHSFDCLETTTRS
jgi:hypothetical protein